MKKILKKFNISLTLLFFSLSFLSSPTSLSQQLDLGNINYYNELKLIYTQSRIPDFGEILGNWQGMCINSQNTTVISPPSFASKMHFFYDSVNVDKRAGGQQIGENYCIDSDNNNTCDGNVLDSPALIEELNICRDFDRNGICDEFSFREVMSCGHFNEDRECDVVKHYKQTWSHEGNTYFDKTDSNPLKKSHHHEGIYLHTEFTDKFRVEGVQYYQTVVYEYSLRIYKDSRDKKHLIMSVNQKIRSSGHVYGNLFCYYRYIENDKN